MLIGQTDSNSMLKTALFTTGTVALGLLFARRGGLRTAKNVLPKLHSGATNPKMNSVLTNMRELLVKNKGKHVSADEIVSVFKKDFPNVNLQVLDDLSQGEGLIKISGFKAVARSPISENFSGFESHSILINSKSFMDKLKKILHIRNNKKEFYVTSSFAENLFHESTHIVQNLTKPQGIAYQRSLDGALSYLKNKFDWIDGISFDDAFVFQNLVYREEWFFNQGKFTKKLMRNLNSGLPHSMEKREKIKLVATRLKHLIREAQAEKEAYELEKLNQLYYAYPRASKKLVVNDIFRQKARSNGKDLKFNEKIEAMKKEYFALIDSLRRENAHKLVG